MKYFLTIIFTLMCVWAEAQMMLGDSLPDDSSKTVLATKLGVPFGGLSKLEAEIYDGDSLRRKVYEGTYLLKINSINNQKLRDTLILRFTDETETLANDDFSLYELIYKKTVGSLSNTQIEKMKQIYVGKRITIMAYETGEFKGTPDKYFEYKPIKPGVPHHFATTGFHFEHSLVIVSNLTK